MSKKSLELLSEEDRFMYQLSRAERLATKLNVMYYIGNFFDSIHLITPVRPELQLLLSLCLVQANVVKTYFGTSLWFR